MQDVGHVFRRYRYLGSLLSTDVSLLSERAHLEVVTVLREVWFMSVVLVHTASFGDWCWLNAKNVDRTVIPRLTKIIRSGITFVSRNLR